MSSHELFEAITDPAYNGWYDDSTTDEIGDICNSDMRTLGGYRVQAEWSQDQNACVVAPRGRGWYVLGEATFAQTAGLAVTSRYEGNIECFAIGQDNVIRVRAFNDGEWGDWYVLGDAAFSQTAGLAVTSRYPNNIECFAMGQDNVPRSCIN